MTTQTNWYVFTGGPSSGKTKTLDLLAYLGYQVIPEAARILIDNELSKGVSVKELRADEGKFQDIVLQMKIDAENRIPQNQLTFLERGIPDTIAYCQLIGKGYEPTILASQKRRYKGIFLLDQLPFEKDYARTESEEEANRVHELLYDSYIRFGYEVIRVPVGSIAERVKFILETIHEF